MEKQNSVHRRGHGRNRWLREDVECARFEKAGCIFYFAADMESKLGQCRAKAPEHEKMTASELKKHILTIDKNRAQYYEYFTGRTWGDCINYDLCVNTTNASIKELSHVLAKLY